MSYFLFTYTLIPLLIILVLFSRRHVVIAKNRGRSILEFHAVRSRKKNKKIYELHSKLRCHGYFAILLPSPSHVSSGFSFLEVIMFIISNWGAVQFDCSDK